MARIRQIKPEMFDDPDLGVLSPLARWVFAGLLTQADKAGRLVDDPRRLKVRIIPFDDVDLDAVLTDLHAAQMVIRYTVDGRNYLQVRTFEKHQRPHQNEPETTIPAPTCDFGTRACDFGTRACDTQGADHDPDTRSKHLDPSTQIQDSAHARFDAFWVAYPRKVGKDAARAAWRRRAPSEALTVNILAALEAQKASYQWQRDGGQFIPHPTTWLNQGRWKDDIDPARPTVNPPARTLTNAAAIQAALAVVKQPRAIQGDS